MEVVRDPRDLDRASSRTAVADKSGFTRFLGVSDQQFRTPYYKNCGPRGTRTSENILTRYSQAVSCLATMMWFPTP
jgi:hypothetical protein